LRLNDNKISFEAMTPPTATHSPVWRRFSFSEPCQRRSGSGGSNMLEKVRETGTSVEAASNGHATSLTSAEEVLAFARKEELAIVDLKFVDFLGLWRHVSVPLSALDADAFAEGIGFDGSSIIGYQTIDQSDLILLPEAATAIKDPILQVPTLSLICNVFDPITRKPYSRDARRVAQAAERYLKETGIADTSYWGPEAEFFVFENVRFDNTPEGAYYFVDSDESVWNTGRNGGAPNLAHRARHKEHYFQSPPVDTMQDLRSEMALVMKAAGIDVEMHHGEVGGSQQEIDLRFNSLTNM